MVDHWLAGGAHVSGDLRIGPKTRLEVRSLPLRLLDPSAVAGRYTSHLVIGVGQFAPEQGFFHLEDREHVLHVPFEHPMHVRHRDTLAPHDHTVDLTASAAEPVQNEPGDNLDIQAGRDRAIQKALGQALVHRTDGRRMGDVAGGELCSLGEGQLLEKVGYGFDHRGIWTERSPIPSPLFWWKSLSKSRFDSYTAAFGNAARASSSTRSSGRTRRSEKRQQQTLSHFPEADIRGPCAASPVQPST
jgi:hypothetical protein